jgi:hypothetical protein
MIFFFNSIRFFFYNGHRCKYSDDDEFDYLDQGNCIFYYSSMNLASCYHGQNI